jgi:uncharacterized protein (TIGR00251 family)
MESCIRPAGDLLLLDIKVQPGASKSELVGIKDGRLKVRIAAAPEDGRANAELAALFAGLFHCAKRDITLKTGEKSRLKTLALPRGYLAKLEEIMNNLT